MADYRIVQKLDEKLIADGILDPSYKDDYRKVHSKLNSHFKKSGAVLPQKIFEKGEARLRKWLGELYKKGASQERLTSYLRCGLAHLSFDFIESTYQSIGSDDLIPRALLSFKNREFHKTYFKATDTAILVKKRRVIKKKASDKIKKNKKIKKKSSGIKKKIKKKPVKKKITKTVKKKTANKKIGQKKTAKKKALIKKTLKKKTPIKKKRILKIKLFKK
jgi:hypothetical protein